MEQASAPQIKLFFALCAEKGIDAEKAKVRAKTKFNLEHFTEISKIQISSLIDTLSTKSEEPLCEGEHEFVCTNCHASLKLVVIPHSH